MTTHPHAPAGARHGRDIHEAHRAATPLELLFDLVFVVAIALASAQLHHGIVEGHAAPALLSFVAAFFAIWWGWMNYTWFASAYDRDDTPHRLLTMLQMVGALVVAVGVPAMFQGDFVAVVVGYAVMRLAQVAQWLRAAQGDPPTRRTCLRYAFGIAVVQVLWIARLGLEPALGWAAFFVLVVAELLVPPWAERAGGTPWHPHHIAERYGLFTIIVLGECVLGAANAMAGGLQATGWSLDIALVGLGSAGLVLSLWWMYFAMPSAQALHQFRERCFGWGYGHFFVFAAIAAMGSGMEVVADALKQAPADGAHAAAPAAEAAGHAVSPLAAVVSVALPEALFLVAIWAIYAQLVRARARKLGLLVLLALACIALVVAATAAGLPLPWALPALTIGPVLAIVLTERARRRDAGAFALH